MSNMQHHNHIPFILKPEYEIAQEAISSLGATNGGIEIYPICGYVLHSLFLKLTGAQEQKLKCICWEMACRDFEYRYERFERNCYSECSNYTDKNMVYNDLLDEIKKQAETFDITDSIKDEVVQTWRITTHKLFEKSMLANNFRKQYNDYKIFEVSVQRNWIMNGNQLFKKGDSISSAEKKATCGMALFELFKNYVYKERNKCAHNTKSYQHNLPSLKAMMAEDYKLHNYFIFMSIILLLDTIYVKMFKIYMEKQGEYFL